MKKISLFVLVLSLVAMITACGAGDAPASPATSPPAPTVTSPPAPTATDEPAEVSTPTDEPAEASAPTDEPAEASAPTDEPAEVQVIEVTMNTTGYDPAKIKVKAGSQIRFEMTNTDSEEHDLYNRQAKIDVGLDPGEVKTYDWVAPEKAGTYVAECSFHEGLKMTFIVE